MEENDPFDTSNITTTTLHRYYSQIPPVTTVFGTTENATLKNPCSQASYIKSDIANRGFNSTTTNSKNTNLVVSTTVNSPKKDIAMAVAPSSSESRQNDNNTNASTSSKLNMLDMKLLEELENLNLSKKETPSPKVQNQVVPLLQPPPASIKLKKVNELVPKNTNVLAATLPKVQKYEISNVNEYRNNYETFKRCMDTSSVVNKIWFETTVRQNGSTNMIQNEFGAFRCNQPAVYERTDAIYRHSNYSSVLQPVYQNGDNGLQGDVFAGNAYGMGGSFNVYSSQAAVYGSTNGTQYSEVAESLYSEIPDLYSRVPDEILKPHRPAPPSPLVHIGLPQSMQQIQRKIQQGQVRSVNPFVAVAEKRAWLRIVY